MYTIVIKKYTFISTQNKWNIFLVLWYKTFPEKIQGSKKGEKETNEGDQKRMKLLCVSFTIGAQNSTKALQIEFKCDLI